MNVQTSYTLAAVLAVLGAISILPVFAAYDELACPDCEGSGIITSEQAKLGEVPISVWTDRSVYDHESIIIVQGQVANLRLGTPVTLTVLGPTNNVVTVQQVDVEADNTFMTSLNTAGNLWKQNGTYIIRVQYGNQGVSNKVFIELTGMLPSQGPTCGANELSASAHCIPYTISGATVSGARINTDDKSIVISLTAFEDSTLTINPSTSVIRGIFFVLVDGQEWSDVEIAGNKVTVMFPAGTEEIEIIGTFVIPEFGAIAALVLAIAIISIIVVTAKTRLGVMPKY
jgi:predicted secreted protein with PEFG-CTERM motif